MQNDNNKVLTADFAKPSKPLSEREALQSLEIAATYVLDVVWHHNREKFAAFAKAIRQARNTLETGE